MKDHSIDVMTRADFEQLFADHTDKTISAIESFRSELKGDIAEFRQEVDDRFDAVERRLDAIEKRTNTISK